MIPTFHISEVDSVKNHLHAPATLILQIKSPVTFIHEDGLKNDTKEENYAFEKTRISVSLQL
jgi:hypothetical protein